MEKRRLIIQTQNIAERSYGEQATQEFEMISPEEKIEQQTIVWVMLIVISVINYFPAFMRIIAWLNTSVC
jgi:hypothetical protein